MLQQHQRDVTAQEGLVDRLRKLSSDNDALTETHNRTKSKLESLEREVESLGSKLSLAQKQLQESNIKHSLTREELKVARNNLQHVKQQCQHELRKKERENEKLKDRINKASNDRTAGGVKRPAIRCLNALPKASSSATLHEQDPEDDMYRVVIANYEEREQEVLQENLALRRLLFSIYSDLQQIAVGLELPRDSTTFSMDEQGNLDAVDLTDPAADADQGRFQIALELVQSTLEAKIRELLESCYDRIFTAMESEKNRVDTSEESTRKLAENARQIKELEAQLAAAKVVTRQQQELLDLAVTSNETHSKRDTMEELAGELKREQAELEKLRSQFDEERKRFAEAAIRMGQERLKLQREKEEVLEEKRKLETAKMLKDLPSTPAFLKASGGQPAYNAAAILSPLGDPFGSPSVPLSKPAAASAASSKPLNTSFYSSKSPGATFDVSAIRAAKPSSTPSGVVPQSQQSGRKRVYSSSQRFLDESNLETDDILVETETLSGTPTSGNSPNGPADKPDLGLKPQPASRATGVRNTFDRFAPQQVR
ncbi:Afadin and alpha-actinin-binding-domain-containing protein [Hyaloraphidium curvatum]|nr:Afadin and alpha-actinin-binding-domain-containing protein [Hyaloraphidium curvatum]